MLGLRLAEGINLNSIETELFDRIKVSIESHLESGLVIITDNHLQLSDPNGFLFSNTILSDIFAEFS